jgi:hypothetical protein
MKMPNDYQVFCNVPTKMHGGCQAFCNISTLGISQRLWLEILLQVKVMNDLQWFEVPC